MACAEDLVSFLATCLADQSVGGLNKRMWALEKDKLTLTLDSVTGEVDSVTIATTSPATLLKTFTGKQFTHNGALTGEVNTNVNTIKQDLNMVLNYFSQEQRAAIDALFKSDECIFFVETNAEQVECWGYEYGLKASALTGATGTALADSRAVTVTMTGSQKTMPKVCNFGADLAANIAYLNNLAGI